MQISKVLVQNVSGIGSCILPNRKVFLLSLWKAFKLYMLICREFVSSLRQKMLDLILFLQKVSYSTEYLLWPPTLYEVEGLLSTSVPCQLVLRRWHYRTSIQETHLHITIKGITEAFLLAWEAENICQNPACSKMVRQITVLLINHTDQDRKTHFFSCSFSPLKAELHRIDQMQLLSFMSERI